MERTLAVETARGADVAAELREANFGDLRLSKRCSAIADALVRCPGAPLPRVAADDAELMGAYRFFNNEKVNPEAILAPHAKATAARAKLAKTVLVLHDTTEAQYGGEHREELGTLSGGGEGFFAHVSLAVSEVGGIGVPLGVVALQLHKRPKRRRKQRRRLPLLDEANERRRWAVGVDQSAEVLGEEVQPIHVLDREGDHYELLAHLLKNERRFVVRLSFDRVLHTLGVEDAKRISEALASVAGVCQSTIHIGARKGRGLSGADKKHPPREEREATLSFASTRLRIKRPQGLRVTLPSFLEINVVRVWEEHPPEGQPAVEWLLATSEPVQSQLELQTVVNIYRLRWLIEEYFKAMKSGCAVEKRGFLQAHALENIFTLTLPIAWQMLLMRALSRLEEQPSASLVLSPVQLLLLPVAARKLPPRQRPPAHPTIRQALLAIAALGGHLTRNGDPGWFTLARGFERLRTLAEGYCLRHPSDLSAHDDV